MPHQRQDSAHPVGERSFIATLAVLLVATLGALLFAHWGNRRVILLDPHLLEHPLSDTVISEGRSASRAFRTDTSWRFDYVLRPGFTYPFAGGGVHFRPGTAANLMDWRRMDRLVFRFRHLHPDAPLLRLFVESSALIDGQRKFFTQQAQFRGHRDWSEEAIELERFVPPSWFIAQNDLDPARHGSSFDSVLNIQFETPDLLIQHDSGTMEVASIRLEGRWISELHLSIALQILWVLAGLLHGVRLLFGWRRKALDEEGRAAHAEEQAQIRSEFLATMSHEIRTPLNGIVVPAQMLRDSDLTRTQRENVETILESGNHLLGILHDALDFSKMEAGRIELERVPVPLARTMESVRRTFETKAMEKGVRLECRVAEDLPLGIVGDPLRLRQILMNLVSNALKFTERGRIAIEANRETDPEGSPRIRFDVADTGIGMDPASLERLFQRFSQLERSTTRRYGGTGLGLAIAQGLANAMGGTIRVESALGAGSRFHFSIPLVDASYDSSVDEEEPDTSGILGARVLIVDDNRVNRRVARSLLLRLGCDIDDAGSGQEALDHLAERRTDIVLMDCHMPDMDGFEATRILRAWASDPSPTKRAASTIPVLALTADALADVRERCLEAGMDDVLTKPLFGRDLAKALGTWRNARHGAGRAAQG